MQISILNGIYSDNQGDFRTSYPRNLQPVAKDNGISAGYLRPAEGIIPFTDSLGVDRGAIVWEGACYRVSGNRLVRIQENGTVNDLGLIAGSGQVTMTYSFDLLAISTGSELYYLNKSDVLIQVTDPVIGTVVDVEFVDGYFMTTDGEFLVVTELSDPFTANPFKYGSSEADPDPVVALVKLRREIYALNRYTIEVFSNVGGEFFPFAIAPGGQVQRGCVGTHANTVFESGIAFLGGGRNEEVSVWLGGAAQTLKLSTRDIDKIISRYSEDELSTVVMESRNTLNHQLIYIHLPDMTLVHDYSMSQLTGEPVWFTLTSSLVGEGEYLARNMVYCYNKWLAGNTLDNKVGELTRDVSTHYGEMVGWEFSTKVLYNESRGAIIHELELVSLTGNIKLGKTPRIFTSYSTDGINWSVERPASIGTRGDRNKRIVWLQQGSLRDRRIQRFKGDSDAYITIARLEARMEPLYV